MGGYVANEKMDGWMDKWMNGWLVRWVNGWMDGYSRVIIEAVSENLENWATTQL